MAIYHYTERELAGLKALHVGLDKEVGRIVITTLEGVEIELINFSYPELIRGKSTRALAVQVFLHFKGLQLKVAEYRHTKRSKVWKLYMKKEYYPLFDLNIEELLSKYSNDIRYLLAKHFGIEL